MAILTEQPVLTRPYCSLSTGYSVEFLLPFVGACAIYRGALCPRSRNESPPPCPPPQPLGGEPVLAEKKGGGGGYHVQGKKLAVPRLI